MVGKRKFDAIEMLVATGLFAVVAAVATAWMASPTIVSPSPFEETPLSYEERFGTKHSAGVEEWLIRDYFGDRREGVFVDVGAGHYRDASNTYFLDASLSWSGLAIDAQPEYVADYARYRPDTRFIPAFVSDSDGDRIAFFVPPADGNRRVASADADFVRVHGQPFDARELPTATLDTILKASGIRSVDFMSIEH